MSFIAQNPLSAAKLESSPPLPIEGARGLFPMEDGWHDIDDNGETRSFVAKEEIADTSKGDSSTSAILNDTENNKALSPYASAIGYRTIAGVKGYFYSSITFGDEILNEDGTSTGTYGACTITLTKEQPDDITQVVIPDAFEIGFTVGSEITITNDSKYSRCGKITAVNNNVITVDSLPFNSIVNMAGDVAVDDYQVFCPDKPLSGEVNLGYYAYAEGEQTQAIERGSHSEGRKTKALGQYGHAEGRETIAYHIGHAEGYKTVAHMNCHSEGVETVSQGGEGAHSEGKWTKANGAASHVEGKYTNANAEASHAEGFYAVANGKASHAENRGTASGLYSHAEGFQTEAAAEGSHVEGTKTYAGGAYQHVQGKYNVKDDEGIYADIIGNGTSSKRKNIQTTDWDGNLWTAGNMYIGGSSKDDENAKKVATEEYVGNATVQKALKAESDSMGRTLRGQSIENVGDNNSPSFEIIDGNIFSFGLVSTALTASLPSSYQYIGYTSALYFTTPSTIPENYTTFPADIYFKGDSTDEGAFVPEADTRYTIVFDYDGNTVNAYVSGVPVPTNVTSEVTE